MSRPRSGTLELRPSGWHLRVTLDVRAPDGTVRQERRWIPLETHDHGKALRLRDRIVADIAAGRLVAEARAEAKQPESAETYFTSVLERRRAMGVRMVPSEKINLEKHFKAHLRGLTVPQIARGTVRAVLEAAVAKGLARETVAKLRRQLVLYLNAAIDSGLVEHNVALGVKLPPMRGHVEKPRVQLRDDELERLLVHAAVDVEVKMLAVIARTLGGMATVQLVRWEWAMVDRVDFAAAMLPQRKGRPARALAIPEVLRPFLREWWKQSGEPEAGPVFPARRGDRKGDQRREHGVSFARRLRTAMLRAEIRRHTCTRAPKAPRMNQGEACCAAMARDPLYAETSTSRPVDFHSMRRRFNTALAEANVNVQNAMQLAGHSDPKVHMRYVAEAAAPKLTPAAALPLLDLAVAEVLPRPMDDSTAKGGAANASGTPGERTEPRAAKPTKGRKKQDGAGLSSQRHPPLSLRAGNEIRTRDPQLGNRSRKASTRRKAGGMRQLVRTHRPPLRPR